MSLPQRIAALTAQLPPEKQDEVLDFVEFLRLRAPNRTTLQPAPGSIEAARSYAWHRATEVPDPAEPDWSPADIEALSLEEPST
jgi:hypothetical protein